MTTVFIRVDADISEDLVGAFPQLTVRHQPASTTLSGTILDQQQLQGVLGLLDLLRVPITEVIAVPDALVDE
jgi:hypothetical protein